MASPLTQLLDPQLPLEKLKLWGNTIADGAMNLLTNALVISTNLVVLNLSNISDFTLEGWWAVFGALQSPSCMLQKLNLCRNCFSDEEMSPLANSLLNNYVLRHLL